MSKELVIADTHLGHRNIIRYCGRPFNSVVHMDAEIIRRWNEKVRPNDRVYHLGDFALVGKSKETIANYVSQLNGHKTLILGNHDKQSIGWWEDVGFDQVVKNQIEIGDYLFTHYPIPERDMLYSDKINVHGHVHKYLIQDSKHICVCVEYTNYYPVLLKDLPRMLKTQNGRTNSGRVN